MTREEHLEFAKTRARAYVERGDLEQAWASFASDLQAHEELKNHGGLQTGFGLMMLGNLNTQEKMRRFIEQFH